MNDQIRIRLSSKNWLTYATRKSVKERIVKDPYTKAYPALIRHFSTRKALEWSDAVVGLHIVYGWMPTIPKLEFVAYGLPEKRELLGRLREVKDKRHVPNADEMEIVRRFANNSVVGASKLLHFLSPRTCPIWDMRVARVMARRKHLNYNQMNRSRLWCDYANELNCWVDDRAVRKAIEEVRAAVAGDCRLPRCSRLRVVELVLFHARPRARAGVKAAAS